MDFPIRIRIADLRDAVVVRDFNLALARETESVELDPELVLAGVRALLQDPGKGRYFVATVDTPRGEEVVGQVMHTQEWSDWRNGMFWWLQSVYVAPAFRKRGVFTALYVHLETLARADGTVCGLRLYLERHNERARRSYLRLGFGDPGYQVLSTPNFLTTPPGARPN